MEFTEYASLLSFRFLGPNARLPRPLDPLVDAIFRRAGALIEICNTRLPVQDEMTRRALSELCRIPRMSTFAIASLINYGVSLMPRDQAYLNVGVWNGFSFLAGLVNNPDKVCIGVDNFSEFGGPREGFLKRFERYKSLNHDFFDMDYREYLSKVHRRQIGFYVFDGPHSYEDQLNGLELAEPFFGRNCRILVDDTNWQAPREATMKFVESRGDRYRVIFDQRTSRNGHPTFWNGIIIVERGGSLHPTPWIQTHAEGNEV